MVKAHSRNGRPAAPEHTGTRTIGARKGEGWSGKCRSPPGVLVYPGVRQVAQQAIQAVAVG